MPKCRFLSLISPTHALQIQLFGAVLLLLLRVVPPTRALVVLSPPFFHHVKYETPEFNYIPNQLPVTGEIVAWRAGLPADTRIFENKILFCGPQVVDGPAVLPISFEEAWRRFRKFGPIAIIYATPASDHPGVSEINTDERDHSDLEGLTVVEMGYSDGIKFQEQIKQAHALNASIIVKIDLGGAYTDPIASPLCDAGLDSQTIKAFLNAILYQTTDENKWRVVRQSSGWIAWSVIYGAMAAGCAMFALVKLIAVIRSYGVEISITQFCLLICWIANTVRLFYFVTDPLFLGRQITSYAAQQILVSITWPADVICNFLITIYWHECISQSDIKMLAFPSKLKIPFIVVSLLIVAIEVAVSSLRASHIAVFLGVAVTAVIYLIILLGISIYFFVVAHRTLRQLKQVDSLSFGPNSTVNHAIRKMTSFIICIATLNILWVAFQIGFLASFGNIAGLYVFFSFIHLGQLAASLVQTLMLKTPLRLPRWRSAMSENTEATVSGDNSSNLDDTMRSGSNTLQLTVTESSTSSDLSDSDP